MRSGRTLRRLCGHASFVNDASFTEDDRLVLSASSDATVKVDGEQDAAALRCYRVPRVTVIT